MASKKKELLEEGLIPSRVAARCLGITPQAVAKLIKSGRLRTVRRKSWPGPLIPISNLIQEGRRRGITKEEIAFEINKELKGFWGALFESWFG